MTILHKVITYLHEYIEFVETTKDAPPPSRERPLAKHLRDEVCVIVTSWRGAGNNPGRDSMVDGKMTSSQLTVELSGIEAALAAKQMTPDDVEKLVRMFARFKEELTVQMVALAEPLAQFTWVPSLDGGVGIQHPTLLFSAANSRERNLEAIARSFYKWAELVSI